MNHTRHDVIIDTDPLSPMGLGGLASRWSLRALMRHAGSSSPAQGHNGTCNGDSGGPNFFVDAAGHKIPVGVTSSGDNRCRASSIISRLDIPQAQDFVDFAVDATTDAEYAACECTTLNNVGVCH